jgi:predicted Zn-dependent protease
MVKRALLSLALAAACTDPAIPDRRDAYGFRDPSGAVFRWPADRLPVRFYADDRGPMRTIVAQGIAAWEAQFLYGELRGTLVSDSTDADVIVRWGGAVPPDVAPDTGAPVSSCSGVTQVVFDTAGTTLAEPMRVTVNDLGGAATAPQRVACAARVTTHELGHSLGLLQHSGQATDLMAAQPLVDRPTTRDRITVEVLYHTAPTIGPPPR